MHENILFLSSSFQTLCHEKGHQCCKVALLYLSAAFKGCNLTEKLVFLMLFGAYPADQTLQWDSAGMCLPILPTEGIRANGMHLWIISSGLSDHGGHTETKRSTAKPDQVNPLSRDANTKEGREESVNIECRGFIIHF